MVLVLGVAIWLMKSTMRSKLQLSVKRSPGMQGRFFVQARWLMLQRHNELDTSVFKKDGYVVVMCNKLVPCYLRALSCSSKLSLARHAQRLGKLSTWQVQLP